MNKKYTFRCPYCGKLRDFIPRNGNPRAKRIKCFFCNKTFIAYKNINKHQLTKRLPIALTTEFHNYYHGNAIHYLTDDDKAFGG